VGGSIPADSVQGAVLVLETELRSQPVITAGIVKEKFMISVIYVTIDMTFWRINAADPTEVIYGDVDAIGGQVNSRLIFDAKKKYTGVTLKSPWTENVSFDVSDQRISVTDLGAGVHDSISIVNTVMINCAGG
jgi:hypothetical protein